MEGLRDKKGVPFHVGDIVKVFHFTGARRKRYYMYKQVISVCEKWVKFSHLDMTDDNYPEHVSTGVLKDYEIVQSIKCDHDELRG